MDQVAIFSDTDKRSKPDPEFEAELKRRIAELKEAKGEL